MTQQNWPKFVNSRILGYLKWLENIPVNGDREMKIKFEVCFSGLFLKGGFVLEVGLKVKLFMTTFVFNNII